MLIMDYSVVIRTLGKAGQKYQKTLESVASQSIKPSDIIIYIAEGYDIPKETIGIEKYVYVKKGMVAQRALPYKEVKTEYILFLDDDVYLPSNAVEILYNELITYEGDVISPCTFDNHKVSLPAKIKLTLIGDEVCRPLSRNYGFKVLRTGGFSYNNNPTLPVYESQSNAGPCFFCRKDVFLDTHFEEELWLDEVFYALPEDQVMFYKMHLSGFKVLTSFDSGIIHLDAGSATAWSSDKTASLVYSKYRNRLLFWYKFLYSKQKLFGKLLCFIALAYSISIHTISFTVKYLRGEKLYLRSFLSALKESIHTIVYHNL